MRRKEAVEVVKTILKGYFPSDYVIEEAADQVLGALEGLGMLPPLTDEDKAYNPTLDAKWDEE